MKRVVIVGGGFAGSHVAKKLEYSFHVTLIDTKDYFEFTPSVPRTLVEPQHVRKIQVLHAHYLQKTTVIRSEVVTVTSSRVITPHGTYAYDYLVIASGSLYALPIKEKDVVIASRASLLREYAERMRNASSILIVGGGLVGVELAAEIATHFSGKKMTIIHAQSELIERNPPKAREYAKRFLQKRGVDIFFNELFVGKKENRYCTNKETKIRADLVFLCTGIVAQSSFLKNHFKENVDAKGFIRINEYLQLSGSENIFVAGDVAAVREEKTAQNAEKQGRVVAENIKRKEVGKALEKYESNSRIMVISLGKWNGILVYKNFVLTGIIPGILKTLIEWKEMMKYK